MPRVPRPVVLHLADVLALAAHVAAVAFMRSPSLAAAVARAVADPPLSAALSQRPAQADGQLGRTYSWEELCVY